MGSGQNESSFGRAKKGGTFTRACHKSGPAKIFAICGDAKPRPKSEFLAKFRTVPGKNKCSRQESNPHLLCDSQPCYRYTTGT